MVAHPSPERSVRSAIHSDRANGEENLLHPILIEMFFCDRAALHRNIRPRPTYGYDQEPHHSVGGLPQKG
jgi:hypothetical protein